MITREGLLRDMRAEAVGIRDHDDVVNRAYSLADIVLAFLTIEDRAGE
jgi:hypothetical protein